MEFFNQLKLAAGTLDAIAAMGYETPTPIQAQAIPPFLDGRDLLAQARTGTGKTASFGIPLVDRFRGLDNAGIVGLVLVPTRELALQVAEEVSQIAKGSRLRVVPIYGGVGFGNQTTELRKGGTILLVATPGRLLDHLGQGTLKLDRVKMLILDEADRMLDMGFLPDVERILRGVPKERQTGLFSATVPDPIRRLSQRFLRDPENVKVESGPTATPLCEQFRLMVPKDHKQRTLLHLLHKEQPERAIVFTRTKHLARRLAEQLGKGGWLAVPLQGNMSQNQRERAMEAFRKGEARIMVATDVAARGIDVPEIGHIVNYDLPDEPEAYVHRIGRTGRMGRSGKAFTFVEPGQERDLRDVERIAGSQMNNYTIGVMAAESPLGPDVGKASPVVKGPSSPQNTPGFRHGGGPGHHAKKRPGRGPGRGSGGPPRHGGGSQNRRW